MYRDTDEQLGRVRCTICAEHFNQSDKWISPKSWKGHLNTQRHKDAVREHNAELTTLQAQRDALQQSLESVNVPPVLPSFLPLSDLAASLTTSRLAMTAPVPVAQGHHDMFTSLDYETADFTAGEEVRQNLRERLDRQMHELELWDSDQLAATLGYGSTQLEGLVDNHTLEAILEDIDYSDMDEEIEEVLLTANTMASSDPLAHFQTCLHNEVGIPTHKYMSPLGHIFYMNDIGGLISQDFANPLTRTHMHLYPEEPGHDTPISEVWHADRWHKELPHNHLTPMYVAGTKHFFIDEFARDHAGALFIPRRWVMRGGELCADAFIIETDGQGVYHVIKEKTVSVRAANFRQNYPDLIAAGDIIQCHDNQSHF
ncbi:hypothetical protein BKA93DRAFT_881863, partial [Sparassis latifolia]